MRKGASIVVVIEEKANAVIESDPEKKYTRIFTIIFLYYVVYFYYFFPIRCFGALWSS